MKKHILGIIMAAVMIFSLMIFPAGAADYKLGDINGDGRVTPADVTALRLYIAGKTDETVTVNKQAADLNQDGRITPADVTTLRLYIAGKINISGSEEKTELTAYTIVYPAEYTKYEIYAAELLQDYVMDHFDIELPMTDDSSTETEYEFLIGNTNRAASTTDVSCDNGEYLLMSAEKKIVLQGKSYMIGGAVGALTYNGMRDGCVINSAVSDTAAPAAYTPLSATGVILMIGDGMGYNHIGSADKYYTRRDKTWDGFTAEEMPNKGSVSTFCLDGSNLLKNGMFKKVVTDSAASGTAMATGWKTYSTYLGMNYKGEEITNVREVANALGYKTGVLTTDEAYKATPAAFTVHNISRYNYAEIQAAQQALLDSGDLSYLRGEVGEELLTQTKTVLDLVSTDSNGFFAMIEEAYTDIYAAPGQLTSDLFHAVARIDSAVEYAMTFAAAHPDTVLIVTADHETGNVDESGGVGNNGAHTMKDVPIFAMGAGTEIFNEKRIENIEIGQFIASVYGVDAFGGFYNNIAD